MNETVQSFIEAYSRSFLAYEDKRLSKKLPRGESAYESPYLNSLKHRLSKNLVKKDLINWGITLEDWRAAMIKIINRFETE